MATNTCSSVGMETLFPMLISELKLCFSKASINKREPAIINKLKALADKEFLSESKNKLKDNEEFPVPSLEYVIPMLLTQECHNYILFDSVNMKAVIDEKEEIICSRRVIGDEEYKKIFNHFNKRILPFNVWKELLSSELSVRLCYDDHIIVKLGNMKFAESIDKSDKSNLEPDRFSKLRLVKIEDFEKVQYSINVPAEHLFPGQCSCLDPNIQGAQIESIFDDVNKSNSKSTKDKQPVSNCSEKSSENNSENLYSPCPMALFLAARSFWISKKSKFNEMSIVEMFFFEYCCEAVNQNITIKKVLCVAKAHTGHFCITNVEADNLYFNKNLFKKENVEVEKQSEVDRIIHSIYHKYLNECSSQITVFHKPNTGEYQKIFSVTFDEGTKTSHFSEFDTLFEEKKENPEVSLVHIPYAEVPENSLQSNVMICEETDKAKRVPFDDVYGWFKGKEKHSFELIAGVEHLRDCKEKRRHILLNYDDNVKNELQRLKRMLEDTSATEQSSKKRKTEDSMEVGENSSNEPPSGEKHHDSFNKVACDRNSMEVGENSSNEPPSGEKHLDSLNKVACDTNSMEVDENSSNDNLSGEKIPDNLNNDEFDFDKCIFELQDTVDIFESESNVHQRDTKKQTSLEQILDKCLNNKKKLGSWH